MSPPTKHDPEDGETRLRTIFVRAGEMVDELHFDYSDGTGNRVQIGFGGGWLAPFTLERGEYVVEVGGSAGWFFNSVFFVTNLGRKSDTYGGSGGVAFSHQAKPSSQVWSVACSLMGPITNIVERPLSITAAVENKESVEAPTASVSNKAASMSSAPGSAENAVNDFARREMEIKNVFNAQEEARLHRQWEAEKAQRAEEERVKAQRAEAELERAQKAEEERCRQERSQEAYRHAMEEARLRREAEEAHRIKEEARLRREAEARLRQEAEAEQKRKAEAEQKRKADEERLQAMSQNIRQKCQTMTSGSSSARVSSAREMAPVSSTLELPTSAKSSASASTQATPAQTSPTLALAQAALPVDGSRGDDQGQGKVKVSEIMKNITARRESLEARLKQLHEKPAVEVRPTQADTETRVPAGAPPRASGDTQSGPAPVVPGRRSMRPVRTIGPVGLSTRDREGGAAPMAGAGECAAQSPVIDFAGSRVLQPDEAPEAPEWTPEGSRVDLTPDFTAELARPMPARALDEREGTRRTRPSTEAMSARQDSKSSNSEASAKLQEMLSRAGERCRLVATDTQNMRSMLDDVEGKAERLATTLNEKEEMLKTELAEVARLHEACMESQQQSQRRLERARGAERESFNLRARLRGIEDSRNASRNASNCNSSQVSDNEGGSFTSGEGSRGSSRSGSFLKRLKDKIRRKPRKVEDVHAHDRAQKHSLLGADFAHVGGL